MFQTSKQLIGFLFILVVVFALESPVYAAKFTSKPLMPQETQSTPSLQDQNHGGNRAAENPVYQRLSRPYSEYLLHQQNVTLPESSIQHISDYPVYNGAPMLSFYHGSTLEGFPNTPHSAAQIQFNRIFFTLFWVAAFSLILITWYQKTEARSEKPRALIFPIFVIRKGKHAQRQPLILNSKSHGRHSTRPVVAEF